jgi:hypothetical protein
MLFLKAAALAFLFVSLFVYGQYLFSRYLDDPLSAFLDSIKEKWYHIPVIIAPFIALLFVGGWFLTP